jgi:hypothetical protein
MKATSDSQHSHVWTSSAPDHHYLFVKVTLARKQNEFIEERRKDFRLKESADLSSQRTMNRKN